MIVAVIMMMMIIIIIIIVFVVIIVFNFNNNNNKHKKFNKILQENLVFKNTTKNLDLFIAVGVREVMWTVPEFF